MHPRNKYKEQPNFELLALKNPDFRKYVIKDISGRVKLNFKDPNALRSLTKCLLKNDFDLEVDIPENHLVPTVPQRLNYLLWVEDLINLLPSKPSLHPVVIDLGTGPCCIFPLLGCKTQQWNFLASESNDEGFEWAKKNVETNGLSGKIKVIKVAKESTLLHLLETEVGNFDATMCNPPFFSDEADANWEKKSRSKKRPPPNSINPAHIEEIVYDGGEVAFVKKIIADSQVLKDRVKIYTTMLGKKSSVKEVKKCLSEQKVPNFTTTEFHQGKTMRWGVAWSYIPNLTLHAVKPEQSAKKPIPISFFIPSNVTSVDFSVNAVSKKLKAHFNDLQIKYTALIENDVQKTWELKAKENTWSHQRRMRRAMARLEQLSLAPNETSPLEQAGTSQSNSTTDDVYEMSWDNGLESANKRKFNDHDQDTNSKRICLEKPESSENNLILHCKLTLKMVANNLVIELLAEPDMSNKEVLQQVLQYFKNKLS